MTSSQGTQTTPVKGSAAPLVFISASSTDYGWRDRLKAFAQTQLSGNINFWDDSKVSTGSNWAQAIEAAIQRAAVAVILLSPAYLSSQTASAELKRLVGEADARGLKLFPIVLQECRWQEIAALRNLQIWDFARPMGDPDDSELAKILRGIMDLAGSSSPWQDDISESGLIFSKTAQDVLRHAAELAQRSGRGMISSTCLLFAFAEERGVTPAFARQALDKLGNYSKAFQEFLEDASDPPSPGGSLAGLPGQFSLDTLAIIRQASAIAVRVSQGISEIHARHLFGALVASPNTSLAFGITGIKFDREQLCRGFLEFLKTTAPRDSQPEWVTILVPVFQSKGPAPVPRANPLAAQKKSSPPDRGATSYAPPIQNKAPQSSPDPILAIESSPFVSGIPGYTSEFCGVGGSGVVPDHLGVEGLANRLAELIVLRETKLPLAVGLFANWGSGKSHFMNLMDRHMKTLAALQGPWCREIVPIYFNAWHYSDSNLWASLITEVFDALFAHLHPKDKGKELELLRTRLRAAGGVTALAAAESKAAGEGVRQAASELEKAITESNGAKEAMRSLMKGLAPELNIPRVAELLGLEAETATISDLRAKSRELNSIVGRTKELGRRAFSQHGQVRRLAWLVGALMGVAVVGLAGAHVPAIEQLTPKIRAALVGLTALLAWVTPIFREIQKGLSQMEKWEDRADAALTETPGVKNAKRRVTEAEARAQTAEAALAAAKLAESQMEDAEKELRPERQLSRFIEARARSADYRGQLGLVSLARRDFQELSSIFADAEGLKDRIEAKPEQAAELTKLSASVDRVILYIDDLDRCEPDKVVDVLQAVHLLLAYPLFAVVVGVDQRCLKQSLRIRFKGLLTSDLSSLAKTSLTDVAEIPATSLDYLEKIFHIPFHLPSMSKTGFQKLVEKLTEPAQPPSVPCSIPPDKTVVPRASPTSATPEAERTPVSTGPASSPGMPNAAPGDAPASPQPLPESATVQVLGSMPLYPWERERLKDFYPLIHTPRAATRLLNTYRLLRAGITAPEWDAFRGDQGGGQEFRLPMLLLAVAAGQPASAREWFRLLRNQQPQPPDVNQAEWEKFHKLYAATSASMKVMPTPETVTKWLDLVELFAF